MPSLAGGSRRSTWTGRQHVRARPLEDASAHSGSGLWLTGWCCSLSDQDFSIGGISTNLGEDAGEGKLETTLGRIGVGTPWLRLRTGDNIAPHRTMAYLARLDVIVRPIPKGDFYFLEPLTTTRVATASRGVAFGLGPSLAKSTPATNDYPHYVFWPAAGGRSFTVSPSGSRTTSRGRWRAIRLARPRRQLLAAQRDLARDLQPGGTK
jgi:hypothetical protein